MDDKQLVEVLKESKEWAALHAFLLTERKMREPEADQFCWTESLSDISLTTYTKECRPLLSALRALRDEIRSGAIFGSPDKCAVCGDDDCDDDDPLLCNHQSHIWAHGECMKEINGDTLAGAILCARRLLAERKEKTTCRGCQAACEHAGSDWTGPCHAAEDHEAKIRAKEKGPIYPKPIPTVADFDGTCWKCGRTMRFMGEGHDGGANIYVYKCDPCGVGFASDCVIGGSSKPPSDDHTCGECRRDSCPRGNPVSSAPACHDLFIPGRTRPRTSTPPSPPTPKCDDCGKEITGTPCDWVMPSHNGDTRKMCPSCREHALDWCSRQTLLAALKAKLLIHHPVDLAAEKRHRVLMGLERGTDPRMLGTCDLTFDPRKR